MPETLKHAEATAETLIIDVEGFEGPLDLLLQLSRCQKVDLRQISILKLAKQYIEFIAKAQQLRLELAADYLVMAAWLAWLKSRLVLPEETPQEDHVGKGMEAWLAFQLERLQAMRDAAAQLMARDQLGRDFFARALPAEDIAPLHGHKPQRHNRPAVKLLDLLQAYTRLRMRRQLHPLVVAPLPVLTIEQARQQLDGAIGSTRQWMRLTDCLHPAWQGDGQRRRSAVGSAFAAALEMAREGKIEMRQAAMFAPLEMRRPGHAQQPAHA